MLNNPLVKLQIAVEQLAQWGKWDVFFEATCQ